MDSLTSTVAPLKASQASVDSPDLVAGCQGPTPSWWRHLSHQEAPGGAVAQAGSDCGTAFTESEFD